MVRSNKESHVHKQVIPIQTSTLYFEDNKTVKFQTSPFEMYKLAQAVHNIAYSVAFCMS